MHFHFIDENGVVNVEIALRYFTAFNFFCLCSLNAATIIVTSNSSLENPIAPMVTLPSAILSSVAGDTIDCAAIFGQTITLTKSLPAIVHNLSITTSAGAPVIIDGNNLFQAFSVASGTSVSLKNFEVKQAFSIGGNGGTGFVGGGGGVGGGGALYVHTNVQMNISDLNFNTNKAVGGAGGAGTATPGTGSGGGGGGFGGGNGGAAGGGGGGNSGGGAGGSSSSGFEGTFYGGGGGGAAGVALLGGGANNQGGTPPYTNTYAGAAGTISSGGGGAGAGGVGGPASTQIGGNGGIGLGTDQLFGGGGGGIAGGLGTGAGGGGGDTASSPSNGGAGGALGGGGGGGAGANYVGMGGYGGGAGGTGSGSALTSLFAGGNGGVGAGGGGGGGAALGGAIFIQNGASLTIGDAVAFAGNTVTAGSGGAFVGAGTAGAAGTAWSPDIFMVSGGSLIFNLTAAPLTITTAICSDQSSTSTTGGLTLLGTQTLTLSSALNTYSGGTHIHSGTLNVSSDGALGSFLSGITLDSGTLQAGAAFNSSRNISLIGPGTIDTGGFNLTLSGAISGGGSLTFINGAAVTLSGVNTYSGSTSVGAGVTLQGNTTSLQNNITHNGVALIFNQTASGTYSGSLSGAGPLTIQGVGTFHLTGNSAAYTGAVSVAAGMELNVNGSIANASSTTIPAGAAISGSGTVGNLINSGTINPGNSIGTITINGALVLNPASLINIEFNDQASLDLIQVIGAPGTAALNGAVAFTPLPGFYGFGRSYTFLTSSGLGGSTFSSFSISNPTFIPTLSYTATDATLTIAIITPFAGFPFINENEQSVGNNVDALNAAGELPLSLKNLIDSLAGFSFGTINGVLDQMHPAPYSALTDLQTEVGGRLVSLFHKKPNMPCGCIRPNRIWAEPFGNWLRQGSMGEQVGFEAVSRGIAGGVDREIVNEWVMGIGGAYQESDLTLNSGRGNGSIHGYYGAFYTDYGSDHFYLGLTFLAGQNNQHLTRHIQFVFNQYEATGESDSFDMIGQLATAYLFGSPAGFVYPYANVDILHFKAGKFQETGADPLNLDVRGHNATTLRSEAGIALQVQDTNYQRTMCIAPFLSLGWAMECPLIRSPYTANFSGGPISFKAHGWNHTWQLFSFAFGLNLTYKMLSISGQYMGESSPNGCDEYFGQRCNIRIDLNW
ncbi:MAG: Autotransporter protein [Parachlamydiales bacterium]|nr:Autotransporter protein [Parachlamydiales bacterium]